MHAKGTLWGGWVSVSRYADLNGPDEDLMYQDSRDRALAPRYDLREGIGPGQISGREMT